MLAFDDGELDGDGVLQLFSHLVSTGYAWSLPGRYGRTACDLIDNGYLDNQGEILRGLDDEY